MYTIEAKVVRYFRNEAKYGKRPVAVLQFKAVDDLTGIELVKTRYFLSADENLRVGLFVGKEVTATIAHSDKLNIDVLVGIRTTKKKGVEA